MLVRVLDFFGDLATYLNECKFDVFMIALVVCSGRVGSDYDHGVIEPSQCEPAFE